MTRLAVFVCGFAAGVAALLVVLDRLFGGDGPHVHWQTHSGSDDEPGGGWER